MKETILEIADKEQRITLLRDMQKFMESIDPKDPNWRDKVSEEIERLKCLVPRKSEKEAWDSTPYRSLRSFASDEIVVVRPLTLSDEDFYISIRAQWRALYRELAESDRRGNIIEETQKPEAFCCVIERVLDHASLGYVAVSDTSRDLWELSIELDEKYMYQGYGPRAIRLFLNKLGAIVGKQVFQARVEVDNLASQHCMEGLGAELVGISSTSALPTEKQAKDFEERHLDLIDDHMRELATRLGIEPRSLLSHVLDYRIAVPIEG